MFGPEEAPSAAQRMKAASFVDILARTGPLRNGSFEDPSAEDMHWAPPRVTADEITRSYNIATGTVSELPIDPTARAIIAADRKRRNEPP